MTRLSSYELSVFRARRISPLLNIEGSGNPDATEDDVIAGVRAHRHSRLMNPKRKSSDPAMPQAEALSFLLRGQLDSNQSDSAAMTSMLIGPGLRKVVRLG